MLSIVYKMSLARLTSSMTPTAPPAVDNKTAAPSESNRISGAKPSLAAFKGLPSLPEAHRTVQFQASASWLKKVLAFAGPGYLVAVGYMDPGNWATDIQGGSKFAYTLLSVVVISSLMAMFLQAL